MITVAQFRARFPAFKCRMTYEDDMLAYRLEEAVMLMGTDEVRWNGVMANSYDIALGYLTAHYTVIAIGQEAGDTSPGHDLQSTGVGSISIGFGSGAGSASYGVYGTTSYGQRFEEIRNTVIPSAFFVQQTSTPTSHQLPNRGFYVN